MIVIKNVQGYNLNTVDRMKLLDLDKIGSCVFSVIILADEMDFGFSSIVEVNGRE